MRIISTDVPKLISIILGVAFSASCGGGDDLDEGNKRAEAKASISEAVAQDESAAHYKDKVDAFFERHCYDCHDDETKKGGFDLLAVTPDFSGSEQVLQWTDIVDRVESGEMPPKKKKRPPAEEITDMLDWVSPRLTAGDRELREVVQRRLNRIEYENTMHDLLGIDIALKQLLPEDQELHGFDNNGAALAISSHMTRT